MSLESSHHVFKITFLLGSKLLFIAFKVGIYMTESNNEKTDICVNYCTASEKWSEYKIF